jgi:four helix bundle protein
MRGYHQLAVWQRAMNYTTQSYRFIAELPATERYNLIEQLRKRASVPLNIAEGAGSSTDRDLFVSYGYRSLKEVLTCLELCQRLYPGLSRQRIHLLIDEGNQISRMTHRLMQRLSGTNHS